MFRGRNNMNILVKIEKRKCLKKIIEFHLHLLCNNIHP